MIYFFNKLSLDDLEKYFIVSGHNASFHKRTEINQLSWFYIGSTVSEERGITSKLERVFVLCKTLRFTGELHDLKSTKDSSE